MRSVQSFAFRLHRSSEASDATTVCKLARRSAGNGDSASAVTNSDAILTGRAPNFRNATDSLAVCLFAKSHRSPSEQEPRPCKSLPTETNSLITSLPTIVRMVVDTGERNVSLGQNSCGMCSFKRHQCDAADRYKNKSQLQKHRAANR